MYNVSVYVTLKQSVLDPQGKAVKKSLHLLGFDDVEDVRIGKFLQVTVKATNAEAAERRVKAMCDKLLANPVIEEYRLVVAEEADV